MNTWRDELYHHGIKGQKWGVRRYQNADGSYTPAGKKRYSDKSSSQYQTTFQERNTPGGGGGGGGMTPEELEKLREQQKLLNQQRSQKTVNYDPKTGKVISNQDAYREFRKHHPQRITGALADRIDDTAAQNRDLHVRRRSMQNNLGRVVNEKLNRENAYELAKDDYAVDRGKQKAAKQNKAVQSLQNARSKLLSAFGRDTSAEGRMKSFSNKYRKENAEEVVRKTAASIKYAKMLISHQKTGDTFFQEWYNKVQKNKKANGGIKPIHYAGTKAKFTKGYIESGQKQAFLSNTPDNMHKKRRPVSYKVKKTGTKIASTIGF